MKAIRIILACLRKADETYNLINNGDKIVIGLSGGKDSVALLYALNLYQKFSHKKFIIQPVTLDLGFEGFNADMLKDFCSRLGFYLIINDSKDVSKILHTQKDKNNLKHLPCSICSKMKKAAINKVANDLHFNKVAFAHHADDAIETLFMNMTVGARIATFNPMMHLEKSNITFIRPFINVFEKDIKNLVREEHLPVLNKICPSDQKTNREEMKLILKDLYEKYPHSQENFLTMLSNYEKEELFYSDISFQIDQKGLTLKPVTSPYDKAIEMNIRMEVFHNEQGVSIKDEIELEQEKISTTFLINKKNRTIGTVRYYRVDEDTFKIGRFAILNKYRNKGYGVQVIQFLTKHILKKYYPKLIIIHAQVRSKNVYLKAGYKPYGKPFNEAKIKHIEMRYESKK